MSRIKFLTKGGVSFFPSFSLCPMDLSFTRDLSAAVRSIYWIY